MPAVDRRILLLTTSTCSDCTGLLASRMKSTTNLEGIKMVIAMQRSENVYLYIKLNFSLMLIRTPNILICNQYTTKLAKLQRNHIKKGGDIMSKKANLKGYKNHTTDIHWQDASGSNKGT